MSQFVEAVTAVSNPEDIIAALVEIGVDRDNIEVHEVPAELVGYSSSDVRVAEIIVRKANIGARYGDVGATRYDDAGKERGEFFRFIVDDMDCSNMNGEGMCHGRVDRKFGAQAGGFANHLAARAGAIMTERVMRRRGFKNVRRREISKRNGYVSQYAVMGNE